MSNDNVKRKILLYPTVIFGGLSFIASYYVIIASIYLKQTLIQKQLESYRKRGKKFNRSNDIRNSNDFIVTNIITYMAIFDLILSIWSLTIYIPQIISNKFHFSSLICKMLGIIGQFSGISSPLWHLIVAFCLFYLLTSNNYYNYNKFALANIKSILIFSLIMIVIIITIIPIIGNAYGEFTYVITETTYLFFTLFL